MAATRILVVEDDPSIAAGIVQGLRRLDFVVELSTHGTDAVTQALGQSFDVIVLDLMLPEQSGFDVLAQLKSRIRVPIIVLTARTGLEDRLACFDLGAADFVSKPFFIEELVARIQARLPRQQPLPSRVVRFGQVEVDLDALLVRVAGATVPLTRTELTLLVYLVERPGRAVSRDQLAQDVLPTLEEISGRTVDAHVARLRKKLGDDASRVTTVWGIGYRFVPDAESRG
jgi:two-component system OmpR family response regulator